MFGDPGFGGLDMCAIDIQESEITDFQITILIEASIGLDRIDNWSEIIDGDRLTLKS